MGTKKDFKHVLEREAPAVFRERESRLALFWGRHSCLSPWIFCCFGCWLVSQLLGLWKFCLLGVDPVEFIVYF